MTRNFDAGIPSSRLQLSLGKFDRLTGARVIAGPRNPIDPVALEQLDATAALDGVRFAIGMPDLHPGRSNPIGVAVGADRIYPDLVGNDIGCGVALFGTGVPLRRIRLDQWERRLGGLERGWDGDIAGRLSERGIGPTAADQSIGTIGAGNHFAELQVVERVVSEDLFDQLGMDTGRVHLLVHSGSRGLGSAILDDHVHKHGAGAALLPGTPDCGAYLTAHDTALSWAEINREVIAERILDQLGAEMEHRCAEVSHNFVAAETIGSDTLWLHRKGAAPTQSGPVVIPGSRGAASYLVLPRTDVHSSGDSLAHGAGRKMGRNQARERVGKRFNASQLTRTEVGSRVICDDKQLLLEEAPMAYKDIDIVVQDLIDAHLVDVVAVMKPVLTYKYRNPDARSDDSYRRDRRPRRR